MTNDLLEEDPNASPAHKLAAAIAEISEEGYAAGWLGDVEYDLFRYASAKPLVEVPYGMTTIQVEQLRELQRLSIACGGWVSWFGEDDGITVPREEGVRFLSMADWMDRYTRHARHVERLVGARAEARAQRSILPWTSNTISALQPADDDDDEQRRKMTNAATEAVFVPLVPVEAVSAEFGYDSTPSNDTGGSSDYSGGGGESGGGGASGDW